MSTPRPTLVLIGLRGSGKSTLGRALAERRGSAFEDLDDAVIADMGFETVSAAWSARGEGAFRESEARCLGRAFGQSGGVLALGGGTPTAPGAADLLREARAGGRVIVAYLRCTPDELTRRLAMTQGVDDRPSLTGKGTLAEIEEVFGARDALYVDLADHVVEGITSLEQGLEALEAIW